MRLEGKVAVVTGAGQTQGESIGNGRAATVLFAREGAKLVLANRSMASLEGTRELLRKEGFDAECVTGDGNECTVVLRYFLLNATNESLSTHDVWHAECVCKQTAIASSN